jgi:hypothetical protein
MIVVFVLSVIARAERPEVKIAFLTVKIASPPLAMTDVPDV